MTAKALFAWHGDTCVLKLKGTIRFTDCPSIDRFIKTTLSDKNNSKILIDLTDTDLLDSTALGMIAQIAIDSREKDAEKPILIIDGKDMMTLFKSVCFEKVFSIVQPKADGDGIEFSQLDDEQTSDDEQLVTQVQDAHQNLMQLSYENRLSFQEVMEALEQQEQAV